MKQFVAGISLVLMMWSSLAFAAATSNLNKSGIILDGYDAVSYFQSAQPRKGDPRFEVKQGGATYLFSSEANQKEFTKNPAKYQPQFGGWCAYAVADSKSKVDVDPLSFLIQDGRLLLFYKSFWANTREKWLHTKDKNPQAYLKDADANWPSTADKEP